MSKKNQKLRKLASVAKFAVALAGGKSKVTSAVVNGLGSMGVPTGLTRSAIKVGSRVAKALPLFGERKKSALTIKSNPISYTTSRDNPTWSEVVGKVTSQYAGRSAAGIKVRGQQPFVRIQVPSDYGKVLASDVATTSLDGLDNIVPITPVALQGPLAVQASNYQMYVFRRLRFTYTTIASSTQTSAFAICYVREPVLADSGADNIPIDFAGARETIPSAEISYRSECATLEVTYDGQQLFYVDSVGTTSEAVRQAVQGQIRAYSSNLSTGVTVGYIMLEYELDLFFPTINSSGLFAFKYLRGLNKSELDRIADLALEIRKERKERSVQGIQVVVHRPYSAGAKPLITVVEADDEGDDEEGHPVLIPTPAPKKSPAKGRI